MKPIFPMVAIALASALFAANAAVADDDDDYPSWRPNSTSASSITGPIILLPNRLHMGDSNIPLHLDSAAPTYKPNENAIPSRIYAVTAATNPALLNGKKLCGDTPPTWIVIVPLPPDGLEIDAFDSADKPASPASPGLCNTFAYVR